MSAPKVMEAASMNVLTPSGATAVSAAGASCCTTTGMTARKVQYVHSSLISVMPYISLLFSSGHMKLSFVIHLLSKDEVVS